ncbi:SemiSWEET family sugar transporter [Paracoccus sp. (in: a-proteobacteria)]|uniref:SemiSWEET family sugar transporter n=1 Tax=Paracoccus sp. TaxID=267 RepID=UPI003A8876A2
MALTDVIGFLAAILGTLCWLPQLAKTLRSREVRDLSLGTNLLLLFTLLLWLVYGLLLGEWPMILANILSIFCIGTIVVAKLIWDRQ